MSEINVTPRAPESEPNPGSRPLTPPSVSSSPPPPPPPPPTTTTAAASPPPPRPLPPRRVVVVRPSLLQRFNQYWVNFFEANRVTFVITAFIFLFVAFLCWKRIVQRIGPGEEGVIYRLFQGGTVTDVTYLEGLRLICPWNTMYIYNMRVQQVTDSFAVLSHDGLTMQVQVSIRFKPQHEQLGVLHKEVGPDYVEKVVKPSVQSVMRFVLGQYKPDEIYQSQSFIMQQAVRKSFDELASRYIVLDDLLLTAITLPPTVANSIESKLRAQQLSQEFDYRVMTEKKEADRKRTEAAGIHDFQSIVAGPGLTDQYLRYKGIEATQELARSTNPKTVIIGAGQNQLSLILDSGGSNFAPASAAPASAPTTSTAAGPAPAPPTSSTISGPPSKK